MKMLPKFKNEHDLRVNHRDHVIVARSKITEIMADKDRILIIGPTDVAKHRLLPLIDDSVDCEEGAIHNLLLKTKYYTTELDAWIDDVEDWNEWTQIFQSDEAKEIRDVIRGVVICFPFSYGVDKLDKVIDLVQKFVDTLKIDEEEFQWQGLMCCVGFGGIDTLEQFEEFEDICLSKGWECVDFEPKDESLKSENLGPQRFRQVVETNSWTNMDMITREGNHEMDLDHLVAAVKDAKDHISSLPTDQRHQHAIDFIQSLNLGGFDAEELEQEPLV